MIFKLNLQQFAGEEAAAVTETAGAETAGAAGATSVTPAAQSAEPVMAAGDSLPDGTTVKNAQVAAALEKQMKRHPELRNVYGKGQPNTAQQTGQPAEAAEPTREEKWSKIREEYADFYGRDVKGAVNDRFKNQKDNAEALNKLEPMLKVLRDRAGVESNDDLIKQVMDDDSLYEEEANKRGMTIPAYRHMMELENQLHQAQEAEAQRQETARIQQHFGKLREQEQAMKQLYPDFSLEKELQNPNFMRLTSPDVGVSVEDAYYAVHHKELAPQMMAYGMERAKNQLSQTLQAQRSRPAEGAMKTQGQPAAAVRIDPRNMTRKEREEIKRQVRLGKRVSFD